MDRETLCKIESLNLDDLVWYVYIFISIAALYSNKLEKEYSVTSDKKKLTEFHTINLIVLTIAFFIYIYFIYNAFRRHAKYRSKLTMINVISSILFIVAGGLALFLEIISTDSDINNVGI